MTAAAQRALEAKGWSGLADLASKTIVEVAAVKGVGPKAIMVLADALAERGTPFADAGQGPRAWRQAAQEAGWGRPSSAKWAGSGARRGGGRKEPAGEPIMLDVEGRSVRLSSPQRVYFPEHGWTKEDVARYYVAVGPGILRALRDRPTMLHRFPDGLDGPKVYQKRLPSGAPAWVPTVRLDFPRYHLHADELCPSSLADIVWACQMSTVEFHPWNVRATDVDRPDEWRIDLDPMPDAGFDRVRRVAGVAREVLDELGIIGFPKTSGGSGLHVYVRIRPDWEFAEVRRAAWAFATEVATRLPLEATVAWWRKDRDPAHVFIDFNQNARDHTLAAAYSLRGLPSGSVSAPIRWDEVVDVDPRDLTLASVPARFAAIGDPHERIDDTAYGLEGLLDWADRFERDRDTPAPSDEQP
ncbi:DNA polymerase domain-containing protein [Nostocoides sp.]